MAHDAHDRGVTSDFALVDIDEAGTIRFANSSFCSRLGYAVSELVGKPIAFLTGDGTPAHDARSFLLHARSGDVVPLMRSEGGWIVAGDDLGSASTTEGTDEINRVLFEGNPLPMWIYDVETLAFLAVNDAATDHYGYSRREFLAMNIEQIRPVDEAARLRDAVSSVEAGVTRSRLWRHMTKSGAILIVDITSHQLQYEGRAARLVVAEDVTEREAARRALQQSEEQHRRLVELSPDLVVILREGTIAFINSEGVQMLGAESREGLLGRSFLDFVPPAFRDIVKGRLQQIVEFGLSIPLVEEKLLSAGGELFPVELVAMPFSYHDEEAVLLVVRDVSERVRSTELVARSHALLEATLDSTADGILVLDHACRVLSTNRRLMELWGLGADSEASSLFPELLTRLAVGNKFVERLDHLATHPHLESREDLTLLDGRILEGHSLPYRAGGEVQGRVWSFREVTQERRTADLLRRRDKILEAVSYAAERLLAVPDWRNSLLDVLTALGEATEVDRAYILSVAVDEYAKSRLLAEYTSDPSFAADANEYGSEEASRMTATLLEELRGGNTVMVHTPDAEPEFRLYLEEQKTISFLMVPVELEGELWGYFGFDDCRRDREWSVAEIEALRAAARSFSAALSRSRTEEALRTSEERYRLLFQRNLAGVFRNTPDGRIIDCNDSCARILGFGSRDELLTQHAYDAYFAPEQRELLIEQLEKSGSLMSVELCLKRADGRAVWVLENVTLLTLPDGQRVMEGTIVDITDRKRAEDALRQSEERYRLMAENTTDMISRQTSDGVYLYASPASRLLLGHDPHHLVGRLAETFVHPEDREEFFRSRKLVLESDVVHTQRCRMRRFDDTFIWVETTSRSVRNAQSADAVEMISVSRDITERKRAEELIEFQAYHDPLTGLPNRVMFNDRLTLALNRARRVQKQVAVMFLDLDNFKIVNDTHGHTAGDQLLRDVAARLRGAVREEDTLARFGGDEFTLLLFELESVESACKVGEKILASFERPFFVGSQQFQISTSIGIAMFPDDGDSPEALLRSADRAMYRAKSLGRHNIQLGG